MNGVRGPVVFCVLAMVAPAVSAQTRALNPTVRVLEKPQSIVPTDCDEGLAPATPRPPVEAPAQVAVAPASVAPPPASDLRTSLRRVQASAESDDYQSFKDALAGARAAVARYPSGGEKNAASEVLLVYGDLERLWDFSFSSRTGSFFDASSADGAIIAALRKYPEFPRAVADATMNIGGQTIYPARESRMFLAEEAAKRLTRLGVRTPTRVVQETPRTTPAPTPRATTPAPRTTPPEATPRTPSRSTPKIREEPRIATSTPRRTTTTRRETTTTPRKSAPKVADATPRRETPRRETTTTRPEPVKPQPAPVTPLPVTKTEPPPPVVDTTPATMTTATTSEVSTAPSTDTTATAEPATTTTESPKPAEPARSRSVNLPFAIILIVIGLAVLVLLFRSSD